MIDTTIATKIVKDNVGGTTCFINRVEIGAQIQVHRYLNPRAGIVHYSIQVNFLQLKKLDNRA
jgi:hypothetical protein